MIGIDNLITSEDRKYLVDCIIHTGCLISKNRKAYDSAGRTEFISDVSRQLTEYGNANERKKFAAHLLQVLLLEEVYEEILQRLTESSIGQSTPAEQIWAAIGRTSETSEAVNQRLLAGQIRQ